MEQSKKSLPVTPLAGYAGTVQPQATGLYRLVFVEVHCLQPGPFDVAPTDRASQGRAARTDT